jgi:hypothetical protein
VSGVFRELHAPHPTPFNSFFQREKMAEGRMKEVLLLAFQLT